MKPQECVNKCLTFIKNGFCLHTGYPSRQPSASWEKQASEATDAFLSILEPWFHPDDKWDRIEKSANEFLYEDLKSRFRKVVEQAQEEGYQKCWNEFQKWEKHENKTASYKAGRTAAFRTVLEMIDGMKTEPLEPIRNEEWGRKGRRFKVDAHNTALFDLKQSITKLTENK